MTSGRGAIFVALLSAIVAACGTTDARLPSKSFGADAGTAGADEAGESNAGGASGSTASAGAEGGEGNAGDGSSLASAGQPGSAPRLDVTLSGVSVLQTLEVALMSGGQADPVDARLPVVAGKPSLFRAYFELGPAFVTRPLLAVLDLRSNGKTRTQVSTLTPSGSSRSEDLGSTFTFSVDAEDVAPGASYRVRILEMDTTPLARFPDVDYAPLNVAVMQPLQVVLVPFVANGFSPLVENQQLAALQHRLQELYPLSAAELAVADPVKLDYVVNGDGDGWDAALNRIYDVRAAAMPPSSVFYFGMLAPSDSYSRYCQNGCILGYSNIADPDDIESRGAIGVTVFPDGSGEADAWDTVAHELGHALGRDHAPCDVQADDVDPAWPDDAEHHNGAIGAYGYDFDLAQLLKPRSYRDVMGYCSPVWISDYTYSGIFERLSHVQATRFRALEQNEPRLFRVARIGRDRRASWLGDRVKRGVARLQSIPLLDHDRHEVARIQAQVVRVDHGGGAFVWLPAASLRETDAAFVDLRGLQSDLLPL